MKKCKRLFSLILVFTLLLINANTKVFAATAVCTVTPGSVTGSAGSTVTIPINIDTVNDPNGIDAWSIKINYDQAQVIATGITAGNIGGAPTVNLNNASSGNVTAGWVDMTSSNPITKGGTLCNVTFQIQAGATGPITITLSNPDFVSSTLVQQTVNLATGTITIGSGSGSTGTTGSTGSTGTSTGTGTSGTSGQSGNTTTSAGITTQTDNLSVSVETGNLFQISLSTNSVDFGTAACNDTDLTKMGALTVTVSSTGNYNLSVIGMGELTNANNDVRDISNLKVKNSTDVGFVPLSKSTPYQFITDHAAGNNIQHSLDFDLHTDSSMQINTQYSTQLKITGNQL